MVIDKWSVCKRKSKIRKENTETNNLLTTVSPELTDLFFIFGILPVKLFL